MCSASLQLLYNNVKDSLCMYNHRNYIRNMLFYLHNDDSPGRANLRVRVAATDHEYWPQIVKCLGSLSLLPTGPFS